MVIDEAHHFRNTGKRGDPEVPFTRSRYYKLYDLIGEARHKSVFMLTATPINNSLNDFKHLVELFSRGDDAYFSRTLGVTSLSGRLNSITKTLKKRLGDEVPEAEAAEEAADLLSGDDLFQSLVVQRSRAYARASQIQETGEAASFPEREDPKVADYSIRKSYGKLLDLVDTAVQNAKPLFALPMYYPLAYYTGPDTDPLEWNRQAQVVGLIRTNFLKRFESSVYAFELSCDRLLRKLLAFVDVNSESPAERKRYERWLDQHAEMLTQARVRPLTFWGGDEEPEEENEDLVPPELLEKANHLARRRLRRARDPRRDLSRPRPDRRAARRVPVLRALPRRQAQEARAMSRSVWASDEAPVVSEAPSRSSEPVLTEVSVNPFDRWRRTLLAHWRWSGGSSGGAT